jgi:hypothetical protein
MTVPIAGEIFQPLSPIATSLPLFFSARQGLHLPQHGGLLDNLCFMKAAIGWVEGQFHTIHGEYKDQSPF